MDGLNSVAHILLAVINGNLPPPQKALMTSCRLWGARVGTLLQASWELDAEAQRVPSGLVPYQRDMALTRSLKEWPGTQVKPLKHAGGSQGLQ